jgi:hypothetical protein
LAQFQAKTTQKDQNLFVMLQRFFSNVHSMGAAIAQQLFARQFSQLYCSYLVC